MRFVQGDFIKIKGHEKIYKIRKIKDKIKPSHNYYPVLLNEIISSDLFTWSSSYIENYMDKEFFYKTNNKGDGNMKNTINYIKKGIKVDRLTTELLNAIDVNDSIDSFDKIIEISDLHTRKLDEELGNYVNEKIYGLFDEIVNELDLESGDVTPSQVQVMNEMREMLIQYIENNI